LKALTAGVPMAAMTMSVEMMQRAAEAAMDCAAIGLAVGSRNGRQTRTAVPPSDKAHRGGADGGTSHDRQDDAA
jgi:hypothetical protein